MHLRSTSQTITGVLVILLSLNPNSATASALSKDINIDTSASLSERGNATADLDPYWSLALYTETDCNGDRILQDAGSESKDCVPSLPQTAYSARFGTSGFIGLLYYQQECGGGFLTIQGGCASTSTGFNSYKVN